MWRALTRPFCLAEASMYLFQHQVGRSITCQKSGLTELCAIPMRFPVPDDPDASFIV